MTKTLPGATAARRAPFLPPWSSSPAAEQASDHVNKHKTATLVAAAVEPTCAMDHTVHCGSFNRPLLKIAKMLFQNMEGYPQSTVQ